MRYTNSISKNGWFLSLYLEDEYGADLAEPGFWSQHLQRVKRCTKCFPGSGSPERADRSVHKAGQGCLGKAGSKARSQLRDACRSSAPEGRGLRDGSPRSSGLPSCRDPFLFLTVRWPHAVSVNSPSGQHQHCCKKKKNKTHKTVAALLCKQL